MFAPQNSRLRPTKKARPPQPPPPVFSEQNWHVCPDFIALLFKQIAVLVVCIVATHQFEFPLAPPNKIAGLLVSLVL